MQLTDTMGGRIVDCSRASRWITVVLTDANDNSNRGGGSEAVLVETLEIKAGAVIDNSSVDLYYLNGGAVKKFKVGDINLDGEVDIDDFVIFKNNCGAMSGATWGTSDLDGDRDVDLDDFTIYKNSFGS